ncbi:MAG: cation:proton antiporter, partial [Alphaproteobacteria bacterium]|nr:cation:proton antiporter [Alphaproteobacteria bacterium]
LEWFAYDIVYRILVGLGVGYLIGRLITWLFFTLPKRFDASHVQRGLVSLSATLFVYGVTELIHGYGFIAVFITAITIRNYEMNHDYHKVLHSFIDQIEHIMLAVLLILLGGAVVDGLLESLTWFYALCGLIFVIIVRPLAAWISLLPVKMSGKHKLIVSFFGIKGIGSFFYLAFALNEVSFAHASEIWSITAFVVLLSIFIHGLTSTFAMKKID